MRIQLTAFLHNFTADVGGSTHHYAAGGVSEETHWRREGEQEKVRQEDGKILPDTRTFPEYVNEKAREHDTGGKCFVFVCV